MQCGGTAMIHGPSSGLCKQYAKCMVAGLKLLESSFSDQDCAPAQCKQAEKPTVPALRQPQGSSRRTNHHLQGKETSGAVNFPGSIIVLYLVICKDGYLRQALACFLAPLSEQLEKAAPQLASSAAMPGTTRLSSRMKI